ncbi:LOW QUALITY PROTEIN: G-patch domain and KOW motifs-containing protein [Sarcophilus harrisii]
MAHGESDAAASAPPGPVSFGFSRTASRKRLEGPREEEKDLVRAVEGRELRTVRPPDQAPRELVIPLPRRGHGQEAPDKAGLPEEGVLRQAVEELLEESRRALQEGPGAEASAASMAIPLVARADADAAPESVGADYEAVPVEAYGLAMLRGMGWKREGIGRTFKQVVKPRENPLRPKGLGLGASLAPPSGPPGSRESAEEPAGLAPGRAVLVTAGPHKGLRGQVEGLDPDNARALVKLAPSGQVATLSEHALRPLAEAQSRDPRGRGDPSGARAPEEKKGQKRKLSPARERQAPHWLRRDLRVRFVDKKHHKGRYYNTKMIIEDVLSPDTCVCRTDEGRLLEGLREDTETLIPKEEKARVMVVLGPQAGQLGRLLARDKEKSLALVQLLHEEGQGTILQLDYDAVCHYVGPVTED